MEYSKDWEKVVADIVGYNIGMEVEASYEAGWWGYAAHSIEYPWIYYADDLTEDVFMEHWGKYLIYGPASRLEDLAKPLGMLVFAGFIDQIKYNQASSMVGKPDCLMCVYCDDRDQERVREILTTIGIQSAPWKYESQTHNDWKPGGRLQRLWEKKHGIEHPA